MTSKTSLSQILHHHGYRYLLIRSWDKAMNYMSICMVDKWVEKYYKMKHRTGFGNPFELTWVDPDTITQFTGHPQPANRYSIGAIQGGDWDQTGQFTNTNYPELYRAGSFEDTILFKSLKNHFVHNKCWMEVEFIQKILDHVESTNRIWGCKSRQQVWDRCAAIDNIYSEIKSDGYKPNTNNCNKDVFNRLSDHILVDVSRNGEYLFADGQHRLAICKLLSIETPVLKRVIHKQYI